MIKKVQFAARLFSICVDKQSFPATNGYIWK